jgi:hypothetical protein
MRVEDARMQEEELKMTMGGGKKRERGGEVTPASLLWTGLDQLFTFIFCEGYLFWWEARRLLGNERVSHGRSA